MDGVALLRISRSTALGLRKNGASVSLLSDGAKVSSFIRFDELQLDPVGAALWLNSEIGRALDEHDDPRGVLFYPDVCEPRGRGYESVVADVAEGGVWIQPAMPDDEAIKQRNQRLEEELDRWAEIRRCLEEAEKKNPEGYIDDVLRTFPLRDDERKLLERHRALMTARFAPVEFRMTQKDFEAAARQLGVGEVDLHKLAKALERNFEHGAARPPRKPRKPRKR